MKILLLLDCSKPIGAVGCAAVDEIWIHQTSVEGGSLLAYEINPRDREIFLHDFKYMESHLCLISWRRNSPECVTLQKH